jgi:hypothetical protein
LQMMQSFKSRLFRQFDRLLKDLAETGG